MARPANAYRAARRNLWRKARLLWREGRADLSGGFRYGRFRYGFHASMPQIGPNGLPAPRREGAA